jgi:hypothetical protein
MEALQFSNIVQGNCVSCVIPQECMSKGDATTYDARSTAIYTDLVEKLWRKYNEKNKKGEAEREATSHGIKPFLVSLNLHRMLILEDFSPQNCVV